MLEKTDILYLGVNAWDSMLQRPQHLARGLSETNRVLFVDPTAFSVLTRLRSPFQGPGEGAGGRRPGLRRLDRSLFVFTPPPLLPFSLWSWTLNDLNARLLSRMLQRVCGALRFRPRVLWLSAPTGQPLLARVRPDLACYDCLDNFPAFYPDDRRGTVMARQEERLLRACDVVLATERRLADRCRPLAGSVHLVPNAVSPGFLDSTGTPCPRELAGIARPTAGYVGALARWVDVELVRELAQARPGWSFVMIGPGRRPAAFSGLPNIHCLGQKAHARLPAFVDRFDVCLIPFRDNALTRTVNPVKLYEYLARGKPVVATRTPALAPFKGVVTLAGTLDEWLGGLESAVRESGRTRRARVRERIRLARENTWQHRTEQVRGILGDRLAHGPWRAARPR